MAFTEKLIDVTFVLGEKTFGDTGSNQVKLTGLRVGAKINRAGGPAMSTANIDVYGMKLDMMNQLSTLGLIATTQRRNSVLVEAGDADGMSTVFQGTITNAWPDFAGMPDVPFRVEAHTGLIDAIAPTPPKSFPQPTDAATILSGIATLMQVPFENNGVKVMLPPTYLYGSLRNQALAVVEAAGCAWNGMEDGTLAIWNPGESRGGEAPLISPTTGMRGYPSFTSNGIALTTLFNPSIGFGKKIVVESSLQAACGTWSVYDLNHDLSCLTHDGPWFSDLKAAPLGLGPFVP